MAHIFTFIAALLTLFRRDKRRLAVPGEEYSSREEEKRSPFFSLLFSNRCPVSSNKCRRERISSRGSREWIYRMDLRGGDNRLSGVLAQYKASGL